MYRTFNCGIGMIVIVAAAEPLPGDPVMGLRSLEDGYVPPVLDISKLDQIPQPRFRTPPQYPFEMRRAGIAGEVLVEFLVDTEGDVQNAFAAKSSQKEFESAAIQAVSKWKFRPGRKNGQNVVTRMQVPIVFTLNE